MPQTQPALAAEPLARPKLEGGRRFVLRSEFQPAGDQPTAIAELVAGIPRASATRCCSAPPAPARPSPSPRSSRPRNARRSSSRRTRRWRPSSTASSRASSPRTPSSTSSRYYDYYQPEAYVAAHRHLHREGIPDQRADRPDAPLGHPGAARTRRRHHRRLGLLHLRHRLGRDLWRDDPGSRRRPALRPAPRHRRPRRAAVPPQRPGLRRAAAFRVRGDSLELWPAHLEDRAWRLSFFGEELESIQRVRPADRRPHRHAAAHPRLRQLALRDPAADAAAGDQEHQGRAPRPPRPARRRRQAPRGAAPRAALHLRPRDDGGHRLLRRHRELLALPHRPQARRAAPHPLRVHPRQRHRLRRREPRLASRRSAACTGATTAASSPSPSTASGCPPAWTTARSSSRSGTRCARSRSSSRPPPPPGSSTRPAASSPSR